MFKWFENLVNPFPAPLVTAPPKQFWPFAWACTEGLRGFIVLMSICTALIGAFEAWLYALLGNLVDWLGRPQVDRRSAVRRREWRDRATAR